MSERDRRLFGSYDNLKIIKGESIDFAKFTIAELLRNWKSYLRMTVSKFKLDEMSAEALLSEVIYDFAKEPDINYSETADNEVMAEMFDREINPTFYACKGQTADIKQGTKTKVKQYNFSPDYDEDTDNDKLKGEILEDIAENIDIEDEAEEEGKSSDLTEKEIGLNPTYCKAIKSKMEYIYQVGLSNNNLSFRPNIIELPIEQKVSVNNAEVIYDISDIKQLEKGDELDAIGVDLASELRYLSTLRYQKGNLDTLRALLILMCLEDRMSEMVNIGIDSKKILKLLLGCTDDGVEIVQKQLRYDSDVTTAWSHLHLVPNGLQQLETYVYGGEYIEKFIDRMIPKK